MALLRVLVDFMSFNCVDIIEHEGMRGIFVPIEPNHIKKMDNGRMVMTYFMYPNKFPKSWKTHYLTMQVGYDEPMRIIGIAAPPKLVMSWERVKSLIPNGKRRMKYRKKQ